MPEALPALELIAFLAAFVALVVAEKAQQIIRPIFHALEGPLSNIPFLGGWIDGAMNRFLELLNAVVVDLRHAATTLWQGFLWAIRLTVTILDEFAGYTESALGQLVEHALPGAFANLYADAHNLFQQAEADAQAAASLAADNLKVAERYADHAAGAAVSTAEGYTDTAISAVHDWTRGKIADAVQGVESDIASAKSAAISTAEAYADRLRTAIEAELAKGIAGVESDLGSAVTALQTAIATARAAVEGELSTAEAAIEGQLVSDVNALNGLIASAETTLENAIAAASAAETAVLNAAVAQLDSAIGAVKAEADAIAAQVAAESTSAAAELADIYGLGVDDLRRLVDQLDFGKLAELGAGAVLLRALVESLTSEAGLDRAECRAKVKGICGTDPTAWAGLLASLAAVGVAFDLKAVCDAGETIADAVVGLVKQAA